VKFAVKIFLLFGQEFNFLDTNYPTTLIIPNPIEFLSPMPRQQKISQRGVIVMKYLSIFALHISIFFSILFCVSWVG